MTRLAIRASHEATKKLVPVLAAFNSEMPRYGCLTKEHENKQLCDSALHARRKTFSFVHIRSMWQWLYQELLGTL